jgi:uncharacterized paraquat-inducible protein A
MTLSTLELTRVQQSVCPHCGRTLEQARSSSWIQTGLGILALAALALMLVPLGMMAWKACTNLLSDRESHSILFHPLEDWTRY